MPHTKSSTTTDSRLSPYTQDLVQAWIAPNNELIKLTIPALAVHHARRGAHLALKAASERLALEAGHMAEAALTDRYARRPSDYTDAVSYLDDVRGLFEHVGWDFDYREPVDYLTGVMEADGRLAPRAERRQLPADITVILIGARFGVMHDALTRQLEDEQGSTDDVGATEAQALLDRLDNIVEEAIAADEARRATPTATW